MSRFVVAMVFGLVAVIPVVAQESKLKYPLTKKTDQKDTYHGTIVEDPYRWLEDDVRKSTEVAAWVEAQNKVTEVYLAAIPERDAIKKRITELWNYERFSQPHKQGTKYIFSRNDGLQNQSVFYIQDSLAKASNWLTMRRHP